MLSHTSGKCSTSTCCGLCKNDSIVASDNKWQIEVQIQVRKLSAAQTLVGSKRHLSPTYMWCMTREVTKTKVDYSKQQRYQLKVFLHVDMKLI